MRPLLRTAFQCTMLILLVAPAAGAAVTDIPFEQGKDHRIYVEGTINGSRPLRFLVDTGASAVAVARRIQQDAKLIIDDRSENTGSDGVTFLDYSTHNVVQVGPVRKPMGAVVVDYQGRPFDAVLGWTFFQGKVLEIDYDRSLLRVHDALPDLTGYTQAHVRWIDNTPAVQVTLGNGSDVLRNGDWTSFPAERKEVFCYLRPWSRHWLLNSFHGGNLDVASISSACSRVSSESRGHAGRPGIVGEGIGYRCQGLHECERRVTRHRQAQAGS